MMQVFSDQTEAGGTFMIPCSFSDKLQQDAKQVIARETAIHAKVQELLGHIQAVCVLKGAIDQASTIFPSQSQLIGKFPEAQH